LDGAAGVADPIIYALTLLVSVDYYPSACEKDRSFCGGAKKRNGTNPYAWVSVVISKDFSVSFSLPHRRDLKPSRRGFSFEAGHSSGTTTTGVADICCCGKGLRERNRWRSQSL
jgi:hypothetical protein